MKFFRTAWLARKGVTQILPLMRDSRVPMKLKVATVGGAALILSPINVLGYIPVIGWLDDAALLMILSNWFVRTASKHVERNISPAQTGQIRPSTS